MKENKSKRRIEDRPFEVVIPTADGQSVARRIPIQIPMEWDPDLGEWLITPEAEEMLESTKARHMGLVLPEEMAALRSRLDLTQTEMGDLLCIGEKTWTRWESGAHRPSQSLNLLLRALQSGLLSVYDLRHLREPRVDWSSVLLSRERLITLGVRRTAPVKRTGIEAPEEERMCEAA